MARFLNPLYKERFGRNITWKLVSTDLCKGLALIVIVIMAILVVPDTCIYAQSVIYSVNPLCITVTGIPGTTQNFTLDIINQSSFDAVMSAQVVSIKQTRDGQFEIDNSEVIDKSIESMIRILQPEFTLKAGMGYALTGQISIPRTLRGEAYAGIIIEPKSEVSGNAGNVSVELQTRFLVVVLVQAEGQDHKAARIVEVNVLGAESPEVAPYAEIFGKDILRFSVLIKNEGNTHIEAKTSAIIRTEDGRRIGALDIGAGEGIILPGAEVEVVTYVLSGLPQGNYNMQVNTTYGGHRPAIVNQPFTVGEGRVEGANASHVIQVGVEPEVLPLEIAPGALKMATFEVRNYESEPVIVNFMVKPLAYDHFGELDLLAESSNYSAVSWTEVRPSEVRLLSGQKRNVQVAIRAPRDFVGSAYALIEAIATPEKQSEQSLTSSNSYTQIIVNANKPDGVKQSLEVTKLDGEVLPGSYGISVILGLRNTGNTHLLPRATVKLLAKKTVTIESTVFEVLDQYEWQEVQSVSFPALQVPILPDGQRELNVLLPYDVTPGEYQLEVTITGGGSNIVQKTTLLVESDTSATQ